MTNDSNSSVRTAILEVLTTAGIEFQTQRHAPARTVAEAAVARNTPIHLGVKSMVIKYDNDFGIFALRADHEIRSRLIRTNLRVSRTRFATRRELFELTGLVPGAVPPFGSPILSLPLFADSSVFEHDTLTFTAGVRDFSIRLSSQDWQSVAHPELLGFSRRPAS